MAYVKTAAQRQRLSAYRRFMTPSPQLRFMQWIDTESSDKGCWIWKRAKDADGYALMRVDGKQTRVSRLVWFWVHGAYDKKLVICHHCDTPQCVNPEHLFAGTQLDNGRDKARKGRAASGERNGNAKLRMLDVRVMRALFRRTTVSVKQLALRFGVSTVHVAYVLKRKNWKVTHG